MGDTKKSDDPMIQCEQVLTKLREGNTETALTLINGATQRFSDSGLVYRLHASILLDLASSHVVDTNKKIEYLANALDYAEKAVKLSPNSIEFALFYSNLYFKAVAKSVQDFDLVIGICEKALLVENPVDPGAESFMTVLPSFPTAEERIFHVRRELRILLQRASTASVAPWIKNLSDTSSAEQSKRIRVINLCRPDKALSFVKAKALEERRKEIEVKVAAARLEQQRLADLEAIAQKTALLEVEEIAVDAKTKIA